MAKFCNSIKHVIFVSFFVMCLMGYERTVAQAQPELIIQLNQFNFDKQMDAFKNIVSGYKALKLVSVCHHLNCVMLKVDRNIQPDDAKFFQSLKEAKFVFDVKTNTTIAQVELSCRDSKPLSNETQ